MKTIKKSSKAFGLKSTMAYNGDVYLSSFGKGNEFITEKLISPDDKIKDLIEDPTLDVYSKNQEITLKHLQTEIGINNPTKGQVGIDYLRLKDKLEQYFYNKTFNDNVHIQIIYNILDIKKVLSLYYYNIVYLINNLNRKNYNYDFLGNFYYKRSYQQQEETAKNFFINEKVREAAQKSIDSFEKFYNFAKPYLAYFGAFKTEKKKKDNKNGDAKIEKENLEIEKQNVEIKYYNYNVLRLLSMLRQFVAHSDDNNNAKPFEFEFNENIKQYPELIDILNDLFEEKCNSVNKTFATKSGLNLSIIKNILNINDDSSSKKLVQEYYDFSILKDNKNIGLNISKLREAAFDLEYVPDVRNHKHDSYRTKINNIIDFVLYHYIHHADNTYEAKIVDELRSTMEDKNIVYNKYAKIIFYNLNKTYPKYKNIISYINNEISNKTKSNNVKYEFVKITPDKYSYFTKYMYFISYFLDGKEINELLTSLINKFDNIQGFNDVLKNQLYDDNKLNKKLEMFNDTNPGIIVNELRICKSFAQMKSELSEIKLPLYKDALRVLNVSEDKIDDSELLEFLNRKGGDNKLRNFISNNIINSKRFQYIVKYMNPSKCLHLIKNKKLVKFVLSQIPQSQIDRNYNIITGTNTFDNEQKINQLCYSLSQLDFYQLRDKEGDLKSNNKCTIERLKAITGLYFTVLYLLAKSIVKINSVFIIAFSCFERDYRLSYDNYKINSNEIFDHYELDLLNKYIELGRFNKHSQKYILTNIEEYNCLINNKNNNSKLTIFREYRNKVLHMNIIYDIDKYIDEIGNVSSYYDIYQYILQKGLFDLMKGSNDMTAHYQRLVAENHSYSNDFDKIINIPFAYNLPRYKKLTIADIFNNKFLPETDNKNK